MYKRSIYETSVTQRTINKNQLRELVQFLASHREQIIIQPDESRRLLGTRPISQTPISKIATQASDLGKDRHVRLINIPTTISSAPEVVTYQHVGFDILQMKAVSEHLAKALEVTDFDKKIIINMTPWLSRRGTISDILAVQGLLVRDLLSRSYFTADRTWIAPGIARYLCKVYSMSIGAVLAAIYNIGYSERRAVRAVFAHYFFTKVMLDKEVGDAMRTSASFLGLDAGAEVADVADLIATIVPSGEEMTLDHACEAVSKLGVMRMETFNQRVLHSRIKNWGPDIHTSALALEYPPYFVYLMLLASSGRKIGMAYTLKNMGVDREMNKFTDDLLKSAGFLGAIH